MQSNLAHTPSARPAQRARSYPAYTRRRSVPAQQIPSGQILYRPGQKPRAKISRPTFFLIAISSATIFTIVAFVVLSARAPLPTIVDHTLPEIRITAGYPLSREDLIARLEVNQKRELASTVHFISQIISRGRIKGQKAKDIAQAIVLESKIANVDPLLITAVIKSESAFKNTAKSPVGARGLMQIMPATGKFITKISDNDWHGINKLYDVDYNIRMGITYLKYLDKLFDSNLRHMLYSYNWGPSAWRSAMRRGGTPPKVTQGYARTILSDYKNWTKKYEAKKEEYRFFSHRYLES